MQQLASEPREWALQLLEADTFTRADCRECLLWTLWHLGVEDIPSFFALRYPGPDHQARWMSKTIGYCKILACSSFYTIPEERLSRIRIILEYIVLYYVRGWFKCSLGEAAARSDLNFMKLMLSWYKKKIPKASLTLMSRAYRQLWY